MVSETCFSLSRGQEFTLTPMMLISRWRFPRHPDLRKVTRHADALLEALGNIPSLDLKPYLVSTESAATKSPANQEELQVLLEHARALLAFLSGRSIERVLRQVRHLLPAKAPELQHSVEEAVSRLTEAEESLLFALDMEVEDEWLPEPAPQSTLPVDDDSIPLSEL